MILAGQSCVAIDYGGLSRIGGHQSSIEEATREGLERHDRKSKQDVTSNIFT